MKYFSTVLVVFALVMLSAVDIVKAADSAEVAETIETVENVTTVETVENVTTVETVENVTTVELLTDIRTMLVFLTIIVIFGVCWFLFKTFKRYIDIFFQ